MTNISMRIASAAHQGRKRTEQQDRVEHREDLGVVCDGMGGQSAGGTAAQKALDSVIGRYDVNRPRTLDEGRAWVKTSVGAANTAVVNAAYGDPRLMGMGSTVLVGLQVEGVLLVGWLGDSRAYRLRGKKLVQLTKDHSLAQVYIDAGQMTPEEAEGHRFRHVLHRYAGNTKAASDAGEMVEVDVQPGDRFLLSSDGIDKELDPAAIGQILASSDDPAQVCQALIDAANANQGRDNIATLVMFAPAAPVAPANKGQGFWDTPFVRAVLSIFGC